MEKIDDKPIPRINKINDDKQMQDEEDEYKMKYRNPNWVY